MGTWGGLRKNVSGFHRGLQCFSGVQVGDQERILVGGNQKTKEKNKCHSFLLGPTVDRFLSYAYAFP